MTGLSNRVARLEAAMPSASADGVCYCGGLAGKVIRIYDSPDSEGDANRDTEAPPPCEACGGSRDILKIVVLYHGRAEAA